MINLINFKAYKYGNINADFIKAKGNIKGTAERLYKHAIKDTTKGAKLIYSRTEPTRAQQLARLLRFESQGLDQTKAEEDIINEINDIINGEEKINAYISRKYKGFFDA